MYPSKSHNKNIQPTYAASLFLQKAQKNRLIVGC